jgi:hypothetical protein
MLRCAQSSRSNVLPKYACARQLFARLASETFLSSLQSEFFSDLLEFYMNGNDEAHPDHADHLDSEKSEANTGCHIGR